ncbi:MAG: ion transporter [Ectothiorhodospiraceae bacterium]|nr:ion transporter [Ectothiorhodospiraceae bacterium]
MNPIKKFAQSIVNNPVFEYTIIGLILFNAIILGLETSPDFVANYNGWLHLANNLVLGVFIIEAALKIIAVAPRFRLYFGDGWNLFDFSIVVLSLLPSTGEYAMIARLARLLRVARLMSTIPELRLIISTLVRSIPSMGHVLMLMSIIFYIYAVAGYHLFHEHDPTHWRNLGMSLLTLFRIVTLEDWTDVMYAAMEMHYLSWIYFISFVVLGTFVVINLFIAVVLNNLEEAKQEQLDALRAPASKDEILRELRQTQEALQRLQQKLERE